MHRRPQIAWLPLLLGAYLLVISVFIVATRGAAILAGHPAYPLMLAVVALGALATVVCALFRLRRQ